MYADRLDQPVRAEEAGYEGVACVDDAARALELYADLWRVTQLPWALRWCEGLVDFILAMQDSDGRFVNFILDWGGTPNRIGRTSVSGGDFWQARAVLALARALPILDDPRIEPALRRGFVHIATSEGAPPDVRALHMQAALTLRRVAEDRCLVQLLARWSDELVACSQGGMLMNSRFEHGHPHLWGHVQEAALAEAGALLGREDLIEVARGSADLVFAEVVRRGFDLPRMQPYDVSSSVEVLGALNRVTGLPRYAALAVAARSWFNGRNPARCAVYDRGGGRVADGVDDGRVSTRSGAEANIVGAQALLDDAVTLAWGLPDYEAVPASSWVAT